MRLRVWRHLCKAREKGAFEPRLLHGQHITCIREWVVRVRALKAACAAACDNRVGGSQRPVQVQGGAESSTDNVDANEMATVLASAWLDPEGGKTDFGFPESPSLQRKASETFEGFGEPEPRRPASSRNSGSFGFPDANDRVQHRSSSSALAV